MNPAATSPAAVESRPALPRPYYDDGTLDWWFPERYVTREAKLAKAVCAQCPVKEPCLAFAVKNGEEGIWGGMSFRDRRNLPYRVRDCVVCGEEFTVPKSSRARVCSEDCRAELSRITSARMRERSDPPEHGHAWVYTNYGCRCDDCREAYRDYYRDRSPSGSRVA